MRQLAILNPFDAPVYHEETVSSTMDVSRGLAAEGAPHGTVIAADFQEAGRGRRERPWNMERGNIPFTVLLRYGNIEAIPPALTLRTGLAVALAIEELVPGLAGAVTVKWPNDIMIRAALDTGAKKAAGILAEAAGGTVHIGIGINVAQREFPLSLRDKATSISLAAGRRIAPEARFTLLETVLSRLYRELEAPDEKAGGADWRGRLEERLYKKGEQVCFIEGAAGSDRIVEGRLAGIGSGGELLITPQGETRARPFVTGELRVY
ncbi:MAG: biotin--[acetyl-CoA-carboxylase] ligase [Treponema sp.]|jgi:BirA family biotin operon repressor/biotin-[acetyl-CoA-carboxylase] ligase|nr:biotin--[acetyl-CoA-carboxylase] ligase [Treponema sp.]